MLQVSFPNRTINQNIIGINNDNFIDVKLQCMVHQSHESARCIEKSEWHHQPLIHAFSHLEGCLPLIPRLNAQLMVATLYVDLEKYFGKFGEVLQVSTSLSLDMMISKHRDNRLSVRRKRFGKTLLVTIVDKTDTINFKLFTG